MEQIETEKKTDTCESLEKQVLETRGLIIAANRGPVTLQRGEEGETIYQRAGGGLVTALLGLAGHVDATWVAVAVSDLDREVRSARVPIGEDGNQLQLVLLDPEPDVYEGYYNQIANPLLWFLQHSMWDFIHSPTIDASIWEAWNRGYVQMNSLFAEAITRQVKTYSRPTVVMLQDYHLYLTPTFLRMMLPPGHKTTLLHFIHIPWPGTEDWGFLPAPIREAILKGLCGVDLLGFQTKADGLNFLRTVESYLPGARVSYHQGRVKYKNHYTHVRDFPISIDVGALRELAGSAEVEMHRGQLMEYTSGGQLIVRVDRSEPSKNIVRGFQAFDTMLEKYPEHRGKVKFLAMLVPSRMAVPEYQDYLDELMAAAGRINAKFGSSEWEPVRVLIGEDYPRAVAALQLYDVLLVNSIADGMNLVAKEGPIVNQCDGVLVLSERTGAAQQLGGGAIVISPCDIYDTSEGLHQALTMSDRERRRRATRLRQDIEREDIQTWLCWQLQEMQKLGL
jgi:trehalose 6-phosphate synthase